MNVARATGWLRAAAIAIAVVGVIDPALTAERPVRHTIAVVAPASADHDGATRDDVARRLAGRYDVVDHVMPGAAATVVVGSRLPASAATIAGPAFALTPADTGPSVSIVSIDAPRETPFAARAPVQARVRVRGAAGRRVAVQLRQGHAVLDRAERTVASADETIAPSLDFVPVSRGASVVSVSAALTDDPLARADADAVIDVVERAWRVLFYDTRPSWASTFVRRALERDPRFSVRSRTQTSTGLAVERGEVPSTLRDEDQLEGFDAVVVGAPAVLTPGDVRSLEAFARYRGGAVVVLLDEPVAGALAGLTGATSWVSSTTPTPTVVESAIPDQPRLEATEVLSPVRVPVGGRALAHATIAGTRRPVAFEVPTGAGRVIVSGLVDAWRYRGVPESSAFDTFWRDTMATASAASPASLTVGPDAALLAPGDRTTVHFTIRQVATNPPASGTVTLRATTTGPEPVAPASGAPGVLAPEPGGSGTVPLRVWPSGLPGHFAGEFVAHEPGTYTVAAEAGSTRGSAHVVVASRVQTPQPDERDVLAAWVATRGGRAFAEADLTGLEHALGETLLPEHRRAPWWPMRSGWWIVALAGALGAEWWLRRRADLR